MDIPLCDENTVLFFESRDVQMWKLSSGIGTIHLIKLIFESAWHIYVGFRSARVRRIIKYDFETLNYYETLRNAYRIWLIYSNIECSQDLFFIVNIEEGYWEFRIVLL